jgi:glycoprotein 2-beta-D-xylosyltransferase
MKAAELEALAELVRAVAPARESHQYDAKTRDLCFRERDVGLLQSIRKAAKPFCTAASAVDAQGQRSRDAATAVTTYSVRGGLRSAVLENLVVDLTHAEIFHPIKSMAEDGGSHDPRFKFNPQLVQCACQEMTTAFLAMTEPQREHDHPWTPSVAAIPSDAPTPPSLLCDPSSRPDGALDLVTAVAGVANSSRIEVFEDPVIVIARRDDHNPFFQISYALNAWTMVQALGWDLARTRVLHLDAGYPSPIDALHQQLFSGERPLVNAHELMGRQLYFKNKVLVAPFELSGPMMQHLDDGEPCYDSELVRKFRDLSLASQGVTPDVIDARAIVKQRPFTVTIITRRPYDGRKLQRVWINEDEVFEKMRAEYNGLNVVFQSIDYVLLKLDEQMLTTIDSDMIIGMHGAGMVNVMWTRSETTVVEIFPKERFRWGYRNLCQFLGCGWHEFRGGEDRGDNPVPNTKDKFIPYDEWMAFFHPLFRDAYSVFEDKQRVIRRQQQA